jgi:hypothetical protein
MDDDERVDGRLVKLVMMTCRWGRARSGAGPSPRWFLGRELIRRAKEVSPGGEPSFVGGTTTDRARVASVRRRFWVRNGYELGCCYF